MNKSYLRGAVELKGKDKGEDVFSIIASTSAIDRQGDSVDQAGWDLKNFNKNPVLLWAHDYSELPIGKVTSARVEKGKLIADFIFASAEANPKAQQIKRLYEEGIVNASSVGFIPLERQGNIITRSELLELSLVPVPANQEALRLAMSKGFDADFIKTIEADINKGAVAEEINAEEMWEKKYENWREVMEIVNAFGSVYFNENTPVENFSTLLSETADLLQALAEGGVEDSEAKSIVHTAMGTAEAKNFTVEKAGAVLSKKNKDLINNAISNMEGGVTALKELLASTEAEEKGIDEAPVTEEVVTEEVVPVVEEVVAVPTEAVQDTGSVEETVTLTYKDIMVDVQTLLRTNDKANEAVLSMVNRFLKANEVGKND